MEQFQSVEHVLDNMDNSIVYQTKSSFWPALFFMLGGTVFFIASSMGQWSSTSVFPHLFLILGVIGCVFGLLKCFVRKKYYVSAETNQKLKTHEIYFDGKERDKLIRLVDGGNLSGLVTLQGSVSGGLKLRFMCTSIGEFCYSQVIAYDTFEYVNLTAPKQLTPSDASLLLRLKQRKN